VSLSSARVSQGLGKRDAFTGAPVAVPSQVTAGWIHAMPCAPVGSLQLGAS
jgi:hypothetical protein